VAFVFSVVFGLGGGALRNFAISLPGSGCGVVSGARTTPVAILSVARAVARIRQCEGELGERLLALIL